MKKIFGLLAISVPLLVASVVATNWRSSWESIDTPSSIRGGCVTLSGWTGCPGDYLSCAESVCPPAYTTCQISTKTIMLTSGYYNSTTSVETGGQASSKSVTVHCAETESCGTQCFYSGTSSTRHCGAASTNRTPVDKTGKELDGNSC